MAQKTLKSSKNYPYLISPFDETTEKHVFLPQKGPYLPNRPNRKRAWDSVTRRVWVYREKFNIDFWFQKFFLTSQHILGLPKKFLEKNPMLNFSGWPVNWGYPSIETLRKRPKWDVSLNFARGGPPMANLLRKVKHQTGWSQQSSKNKRKTLVNWIVSIPCSWIFA